MKAKRFGLILIAGLLTHILPVQASGPIVAIFDMEDKGSGLTEKVLGNLTDYLGVLLTQGGYRVVPRSEVRDRLKQQQKESYQSCYDQRCQIELGRELAAEKTLATWILKIGKSCQVTATLYDLKKATTERASAQEAACDEESLLAAIRVIADDLAKHLKLQSSGSTAEEAQIRAMVATKEAQEARQESRKRAEQLIKVQREVTEAKKQAESARAQAESAEAARLAAQKRVEELTQSKHKVETEELKKAKQDAQTAKLQAVDARVKAEKAEAARQEALKALEELDKLRQEAKASSQRADLAEQERKKAVEAMHKAQASAEKSRREAEEARKYPEGRPTESFNVGIKSALVLPDITDIQIGDHTALYSGGFAVMIEADFMLHPFLSVGGQVGYSHGDMQQNWISDDDDISSDVHIISVLASLKGRLNLGPVEFRPGVSVGFQHEDGGDAGKVKALVLGTFLQTAFYVGRHFALTLGLDAYFQPVGTGENDKDQTFAGMLMVFLGFEYCE